MPPGCRSSSIPIGAATGRSPIRCRGTTTRSFTLTTEPGDCQWRINDTVFELSTLGPTSGTGSATIRYAVTPGSFSSTHDHTISVQGLSGLNPHGVHTIHLIAQ